MNELSNAEEVGRLSYAITSYLDDRSEIDVKKYLDGFVASKPPKWSLAEWLYRMNNNRLSESEVVDLLADDNLKALRGSSSASVDIDYLRLMQEDGVESSHVIVFAKILPGDILKIELKVDPEKRRLSNGLIEKIVRLRWSEDGMHYVRYVELDYNDFNELTEGFFHISISGKDHAMKICKGLFTSANVRLHY